MARILAVDDDEAIRNLLGRVLGKDGHDVRCAACAEEVLALKLDRYDLVLLDVMMPGTDMMRDTTERPEAVTAGTVRLVGTDKQRIVEEVTRLLKDENEYQAMSRAHNPYGDGQACSRILEALKNNRISL